MANGQTTQRRPLLDQGQIQALGYLLGRGASGVAAEYPESWQYQFGLIGADMAKSQQYAQLIKDVLGGGGKVTADGEKTTIVAPTDITMAGVNTPLAPGGKTTAMVRQPAPQQKSPGMADFLRALFSNYSQTQE